MERIHIVIPDVGVLTLHTDKPFNEVHILHPDKSTVEIQRYEVNPSDIEKGFIKRK